MRGLQVPLARLPVRLRPMSAEDLPTVMAIERQVYRYPWTEGIFRDCLRSGYCCWLGFSGDQVVAYGVLSVAAGESNLLNLCVDPGSRRQGVGKLLLSHLLGLAVRHEACVVFLEVRPSNAGAVALYQEAGFAEVGLRADYYPAAKGREDAMVMALELSTDWDNRGW